MGALTLISLLLGKETKNVSFDEDGTTADAPEHGAVTTS
jgi:hypothetical protein